MTTPREYPNYDRIPGHMQSGAKLYIEYGILPGGFLTSILCNELKEASWQADNINKEAIPAYVEWLTHDIPADCQGSVEKVQAWADRGGLKGHGRIEV